MRRRRAQSAAASDSATRAARRRLAALLAERGFTGQSVGELLGAGDAWPLHASRLPPTDARPLAPLVRLLLGGVALAADEAERAFAPLTVSDLCATRLLSVSGRRMTAAVTIEPWEGVYVLGEPGAAVRRRRRTVPGLTPSTLTMLALTPPRRIESVLDLGAGSGAQSLRAARRGARVVAVERNSRATALFRAGAELSGLDRAIDYRLGSWFEPVGAERFELIVANPPYILAPSAERMFEHTGTTAGGVTLQLLRGVPDHLHPGGMAILLGTWPHAATADWTAPLQEALAGAGCDVVALRARTDPPAQFARQHTVEKHARRWASHFAAVGIEAITTGAVALRRRAGARTWFHAIDSTDTPGPRAGQTLDDVFRAIDRSETSGGAERLLGSRLALRDGSALNVHCTIAANRPSTVWRRLRWPPGLGVEVELSDESHHVLMHDGVVAQALASVDAADHERVLAELAALLETGLVVEAPVPAARSHTPADD